MDKEIAEWGRAQEKDQTAVGSPAWTFGGSACGGHGGRLLSPGDGILAEDDCRTAGNTVQRVLIEYPGHRLVKLGQLVAELYGTFEEYFHRNRPEFVIIGGSVIAKQIFCTHLLHGGKDGAGDF